MARHESLRTTFDRVDGAAVQVVTSGRRPGRAVSRPARPDELDRGADGRVRPAVRPARGPLFRGAAGAAGCRRARAAAQRAPHRHRRLVARRAGRGAGRARTPCASCPRCRCSTRTSRCGSGTGWQPADRAARATGSTGSPASRRWSCRPTGRARPVRTRPAPRTSSRVPAAVTRGSASWPEHEHHAVHHPVAACQVLFARYAGQHDVAVGTVTSGRDRAELNRVVGFFVNTVVLRSTVDRRTFTRVPGSASRTPCWTRSARRGAVRAAGRRGRRRTRDTSRNPLFDVMVLLQNAERGLPAFPGLAVEDVRAGAVGGELRPVPSSSTPRGRRAGLRRWSTAPTCSTPPRSSGWASTCWCCWRASPPTRTGRSASCRC